MSNFQEQTLLGGSEARLSQGNIAVREVRCSSLLHKLNFGSSSEYTLHLYKGCSHGCVYCYAPSLVHDDREWGSYVDAKINAPLVLERELRNMPRNVVFISSASDPYQPIEAKYRLARRCLEVLLRHDFPVLILTRSPLALRDIDLFSKFSWIRVGFSISSVSDPFFEPGVPLLDRRLASLRRLHDSGILTWVSLAPIVPQIITSDLDWLFEQLSGSGVSALSPGLLRFVGYEESRVMFEERTGQNASNALIDGPSVMKEIMALAEHHNLDTSCSALNWRGQGKVAEPTSLESFL